MKEIQLHYKNTARMNAVQLNRYASRLKPEIDRMNKASKAKYIDDRGSINLPQDKNYHQIIQKVSKNYRKVDAVFVVGIGGSNLGTIAVLEAVKGKLHNLTTKKTKIFFADTVDSDSLLNLRKLMKRSLQKRRKIVLCFITKSGGTTETIANFEYLYNVLKRNTNNPEKQVVAITDQGSKLWYLAEREGFERLAIPKKVGGRYSVFSAVGLLPLGVAGLNTKKLLEGAAKMRKRCLRSFASNPAAQSAALIHYWLTKGKNIHDTFLFANDLESIGKWYRQLMGESVGKEYSKRGKQIFAGMTPTVSVGSTDLHSMAQLYLGGPYDKFTTFVTLKSFFSMGRIPSMNEYDSLVPHIQGKSFVDVMHAIVQGVKIAFGKGKRPYAEIVLPDKKEETIGQLLQLKMMEMMYLGYLMGVNPFDQPNVEAYKKETKKILRG